MECPIPCEMYILVYTCLNVRAIHLDLLPDMSTESILLSFVRFSTMYCIPEKIYPDNASSFTCALKVLSRSYTDNSFENYLVKNDIEHIRIPLYASWAGAAWERMIRTIKSCLYKAVGRKRIEYFSLITLLSEIKEAINSRPLTYMDGDNEILPICPNNFLKFGKNKSLVIDECPNILLTPANRQSLVKTLELKDEIFDKFKNRWFEEYLLGLREQEFNLYENNWSNKISEGDIVLIGSETNIKPFWNLARIIRTIPGSDGKIRSAEVRKSDRSVGIYPINKLYALEISANEPGVPIEPDVQTGTIERKQPSRRSKTRCLEKLKYSN